MYQKVVHGWPPALGQVTATVLAYHPLAEVVVLNWLRLLPPAMEDMPLKH